MSEYQVIARKWRPQSFSDVVGQEHVVRTLRNAIVSGRTAHAYLFVGPRGIGKTTMARIFAKALNCEHPVNGEPCCRCASCFDVSAEKSLDVMEIDAASRNTTADMRELAENVLTRPVTGKYKIYIVDEVHMLSKQAWNVLLKTVEEPPSHVKFIFATTEVHQVLPTIISRCQRFDLMPIPTRLIAERLRLIADSEKVAIAPEAVDAIARAADGGMRDAQSLLDQMIAFFSAGDGSQITEEQVLSLFGLTDRGEVDRILRAILRNAPAEVVTSVAKLSRRGKNLETLFEDLLFSLRAINLCAIIADPAELLDEPAESIARFRELAKCASRETIQILLESLAPVGRALHDALNKQVFLETVLLKAMREAHAVKIGDILARLNQLRTAGELQFLEKLPKIEKTAAAMPLPPVDDVPPSAEPEEVPSGPANAMRVVQEDAGKKAVLTEVPGPDRSAEVDAAAGDASTVEEAQTPPEPEPVPQEGCVGEEESSADDGSDDADPCAVMPSESDDIPDGETAEETVFNPGNYPVMPRSERRHKESLTPDGSRKSIANEHPQELKTVTQRDPAVKEAVDLFSGTVIDIHR